MSTKRYPLGDDFMRRRESSPLPVRRRVTGGVASLVLVAGVGYYFSLPVSGRINILPSPTRQNTPAPAVKQAALKSKYVELSYPDNFKFAATSEFRNSLEVQEFVRDRSLRLTVSVQTADELDALSSVQARSNNPQYTRNVYQSRAAGGLIFTKNIPDDGRAEWERTAFLYKAGKVAIVSLNDVNSSRDRTEEFNQILATFRWKQ